MSKIRSRDTTPETVVRKFLFAHGFRYRLHVKSLPGKPDLVLKKYNAVVFVHGCFWHMHQHCKYSALPTSNIDYWKPKLLRNKERDKTAVNALRKLGWRVIVIWECQLKAKKQNSTLAKLVRTLYH